MQRPAAAGGAGVIDDEAGAVGEQDSFGDRAGSQRLPLPAPVLGDDPGVGVAAHELVAVVGGALDLLEAHGHVAAVRGEDTGAAPEAARPAGAVVGGDVPLPAGHGQARLDWRGTASSVSMIFSSRRTSNSC